MLQAARQRNAKRDPKFGRPSGLTVGLSGYYVLSSEILFFWLFSWVFFFLVRHIIVKEIDRSQKWQVSNEQFQMKPNSGTCLNKRAVKPNCLAILGQNSRTWVKEYQVWLFFGSFGCSGYYNFRAKKKNPILTKITVRLGTIIKNTRTTKKFDNTSNEPPKPFLFRSHSEVYAHFLTLNLYQCSLWYWLDHSSLPRRFIIL